MAKIYGNRWQIIEHLDRGGQAEIFLVKDLQGLEQQPCVLKRVINPQRRDRFIREIHACKSLAHPRIMKIIDHSALDVSDQNSDKMYLVMPFAQGGNLEKRAALYSGSIDSTLQVARYLAEALFHAHKLNIIHRDIKPANILFQSDDHECLISDFGIALIRDMVRPTEMNEVVGPRVFLAPELEDGGKLDVTPSADVYSLGKVVYFMLSGGKSLPRERHRESKYDIFRGKGTRHELLGRLLDRMICQLSDRISSMDSVISEIDRIRDWDFQPTAPLTQRAESILANFIERERGVKSIDDRNRLINEKHSELFNGFRASFCQWIDEQIKGLSKALTHSGILNISPVDPRASDAIMAAIENNRREMWSRCFHNWSGVQYCFGEGLNITSGRGFSKQQNLVFCLYKPYSFTAGYHLHSVEDSDRSVIFIPYYHESNTFHGFFNKRGSSKNIGNMSKSFFGEDLTLFLVSSVGSWPEAANLYKAVIDESVEIFLEFLENKNRTGGWSIGP